ncbi:MAG: hypothetical protein ACRECT_04025 [Thermoplasmata archaeon]
MRVQDPALAGVCALVLAASLLVGTGVVPSGLFSASSTSWRVESTCSKTPSGLETHSSPPVPLVAPMWATVHLAWTSTGFDWVLVEAASSEGLPYDQVGMNGSGSFVSEADPFLVEVPTLPVGPGCNTTFTNLTVSYSV